MKLKSLCFIILLLVAFNLFSSGNNDEYKTQNSDSFTFKETGDTFKIIRESKNGSDLITIHYSNAGNNYYLLNTIKSIIPLSDKQLTLKGTNTDIHGLNSFSFTGDYTQFKNSENVIIYNYSSGVIEDLITLVSHDPRKKSYQFKLYIKPSIVIDSSRLEQEDEFINILKEDPNLRRYLKKQLLGSNSFESIDNRLFPIANIDNGYVIEVEPIFNNSRLDIKREVKSQPLKYFDLLYDYGINLDNEYGESIIKKLLNIYYEKDKPLFHHYMDKTSSNDFDYTLYDKLTKEEGQEFVNKALTYLTWGLEYSLHGDNMGEILFNSEDNCYASQTLNDKVSLYDWCNTSIKDNEENRGANYLPYVPNRIHELVNENDITYTNSEVQNLQSVAEEYSSLILTTPFLYTDTETGNIQSVIGSSLPYVKGGIDSPRTFNYKMLQQYKIIKNKTGGYYNFDGKTNNYLYSLNDETVDVNTEDYYYFKGANPGEKNPFYPGYDFNNNNDDYIGTNNTGVDIFGLISGALSMTTFSNNFRTINNNSNKLKLLDSYYKMADPNYSVGSEYPILDSNGLPFFSNNPTEDLSTLIISREDIERISVIIPDLNKIQAGDILVGTIDGQDEIAIVVDPGNIDKSTSFDMSEVLVLSVTKSDRRVSLNYWGDGNNYLKSFTLNSKDFIPRRLIKYNDELESTFNQKNETWDPMIYTPEKLEVVLDTEVTSPRNYGNWIPNTGEFYNINSIKFKNDNDSEFVEDNLDVVIEAPTDINYVDVITQDNIWTNKGDGFEFFAHFRSSTGLNTTNEYLKLATFKINNLSTTANNRYIIKYNHEIFDEIGAAKSGFELKYYSNYGIQFKILEENSEIQTSQFAIRPLENNIRPGDDIALSFSMTTEGQTSIATTDLENKLSVYDKKMLWRANLYIDSNDENDWNILYPWNSPTTGLTKGSFEDKYRGSSTTTNIMKLNISKLEIDYDKIIWFGNNEWNKEYRGFDRLNNNNFEPEESEYQLDDSDGRQTIKFQPFTYNPNITGDNRNKKEINVVSYSYGCADSPFEFNDELRQQQLIMSKYYNLIGIKFKQPKTLWGDLEDETNVNMFTPDEYNLYVEDYDVSKGDYFKEDRNHISIVGWKATTSPEPWVNGESNIYIKPSVHLGTSVVEYRVPSEVSNLSGIDNFPYLPGYSLWFYLENSSCPDWLNAISAGVDCNGLVSRSASYQDNRYSWVDAQNQSVKEYDPGSSKKWFTNPSYPYWQQIGNHEIASDRITYKRPRNILKDLDKIKPGDIMYLQSSDGSGWHITLISDVMYSTDMQLIDIKLIESTWQEPQFTYAKVINIKTLDDYKNNEWVVVRPK